MKRTTNYIFFIAIILFLGACSKNNQTPLISSKIPINDTVRHLSSILSVKHIVPLETTEKSLIGNLKKILKYKKWYYVSYGRTTLLQFDNQGRFVRQIGSMGGGPGEFTTIGDFDVTDSGIYIVDYMRILHYTHEGTFMRSILLDVNIRGLEVAGNNILGYVTREKNISYIFDMEGKHLSDFYPTSEMATVGQSSYYWPYGNGKYLFTFYLSNEAFLYDTHSQRHRNLTLTDLPGVMTLEKGNQLWGEKGKNIDLREYATYIWPFNSNGKQLYFLTHKQVNEEGILWLKKIDTNQDYAYDCRGIVNDITFVSLNQFFSSFTQSADSFLTYVNPVELKEVLKQKENVASDYYAQMKMLADSLNEEDNPIIVEYEFK